MLLNGEMVIDDNSPVPADQPTGLKLAFRTTPFGAIEGAPAFPSEMLVPQSEWEARIKDMADSKSRLSDICDQAGLKCKDQGQTNYCWANAPTHCIEILRCVQNQNMVSLSPASVAAVIKNYQNVGGWGEEALRFIVDNGAVPTSMWPDNAIERKYDTAETKEVRKLYRVTEWWELRPRTVSELISCLINRIPVAVGYNWWGHEVTAVDPVWVNGAIGIRIRNSWGMVWGSKGYATLTGQRMLPDDAVSPRVAVAS